MKRYRLFLLAFGACLPALIFPAVWSIAEHGSTEPEALSGGETGFATEAAGVQPMGDSGAYAAHGERTVLVMRVNFGGESVSAADAYEEMQAVNEFLEAASFRQFRFREIHVTAPSLVLPETSNEYAQDRFLLWNHARGAAREQGYVSEYDFEIVAYPSINLSSDATIGGKGAWVQGNFNAGLVAHLLGRNFGLHHAGYWQPVGRNTTGGYPLDNARVVEYGNAFDVMGERLTLSAGLRSFPANHFSGNFKNILGWLPEQNIHRVDPGQAPATFRIHRLDGGAPLRHDRRYSMRIVTGDHENLPSPPVKDYWIDFRRLFTDNAAAMDGVIVQWGDAEGSRGGSHLLYMGPFPWPDEQAMEAPVAEAPLRVGQTYADAANEVILTPVRRGGGSPDEYVDVIVTRGTLTTGILSPQPDFSHANPDGAVRIPESGLIELWAGASASGSSLGKVEFHLGDQVLGEAVKVDAGLFMLETPVDAWERDSPVLRSVATNVAGNTVYSDPVLIEFVEPEIQVAAEPDAVVAGDTVTFTVSRIAGAGDLASVEVFVAGSSVGIADADNRLEWVPEEGGVFNVHATAFDAGGVKLRTAMIQVRVIVVEDIMSFVFEAAPSSVIIGEPVTLSVTEDGVPLDIESVEFWVDGQTIEVITGEPFAIEWTPSEPGTYEVLAVVTVLGVSVASPVSTVSVREPPGPLSLFWVSVPSGTGLHLNAVAFFDEKFIAVGDEGIRLTSLDGRDWTPELMPVSSSLRAIAGREGLLVAVGDGGTILTTEDGSDWTVRPSETIRRLSGIAYGGGRFVAVGNAGVIRTSDDEGETWQGRPSGTTSNLFGVAHGGAGFVAVGEEGSVVTSPDGLSWTSRPAMTTSALNDVAFGDGLYTAVGGRWDINERAEILVSTDAVAWSAAGMGIASILYGAQFGENTWVACGGRGTIATSREDSWTVGRSPVTKTLSGLAYGAGQFVAVGRNGTIVRSTTDHFPGWLTERFSPEEIAEGIVTAPAADPDGAGIANLVRYALGIDDTVADRERLPKAAIVSDNGEAYLVLRYARTREQDDTLYRVEASSNLSDWAGIEEIGGLIEIEPADGGDPELVTARDGAPVGAFDRRYLRLRLELIE